VDTSRRRTLRFAVTGSLLATAALTQGCIDEDAIDEDPVDRLLVSGDTDDEETFGETVVVNTGPQPDLGASPDLDATFDEDEERDDDDGYATELTTPPPPPTVNPGRVPDVR
jgi:hypothetical protein